MIKAKIIEDSMNNAGNRITTWILTYPRCIHAEFMTHRVFSRNASSSRAIPVEKALKAIKDNPFIPEYWGANQKGMQAAAELTGTFRELALDRWLDAKDDALKVVENLSTLNVHKQIANRVTEPWSHITVLATATEYTNFFKLRAHKDAQPEFQVLAYTMLREYLSNAPTLKNDGEWHIPFGDKMPEGTSLNDMLKIATARAARLSYKTFDGDIDPAKDFELHDHLAASGHWSPFEHCACASTLSNLTGNFRGWTPYRKLFANENPQDVDLDWIYQSTPDWVKAAIARNDAVVT